MKPHNPFASMLCLIEQRLKTEASLDCEVSRYSVTVHKLWPGKSSAVVMIDLFWGTTACIRVTVGWHPGYAEVAIADPNFVDNVVSTTIQMLNKQGPQ